VCGEMYDLPRTARAAAMMQIVDRSVDRDSGAVGDDVASVGFAGIGRSWRAPVGTIVGLHNREYSSLGRRDGDVAKGVDLAFEVSTVAFSTVLNRQSVGGLQQEQTTDGDGGPDRAHGIFKVNLDFKVTTSACFNSTKYLGAYPRPFFRTQVTQNRCGQ
jgi:hypothetical protein